MDQNQENAIQSFKSGWNCAQSVVSTFSDQLGFDKHMALQLSYNFGAGMGRLQETCGAVTGAFMALGIYNSKKYSDVKDQKEKTYVMVRELNSKFISSFGTSKCIELINCDLKTEEGHKYFADNKLNQTVCAKCIAKAVELVDELIEGS